MCAREQFWRTQRHLLQQAHRVLPNSRAEADLLCQAFSLENGFLSKVDLVPNAVDTDRSHSGILSARFTVRVNIQRQLLSALIANDEELKRSVLWNRLGRILHRIASQGRGQKNNGFFLV